MADTITGNCCECGLEIDYDPLVEGPRYCDDCRPCDDGAKQEDKAVVAFEVTGPTAELVEVARKCELPEAETNHLMAQFSDYIVEASKLCEEAKGLVVTDARDVETIKKCHRIRMALRRVRTESEKNKTVLKVNVLRTGRAIDGANNIVKAITEPTEDYCESQEKFAERQEAAALAAIKAERDAFLAPFVPDISVYVTEKMTPEGFAGLLESSRAAYEARAEAERVAAEKAEADRKAKEEEDARVRAENVRLKAEADEREREAAAARASAAKAEKELSDRKADEERREAERVKAESDKKYKDWLAANKYDERYDRVVVSGNRARLFRLVAEIEL
ncbi:MAG: hypothetical protein M0R06_03415 [Sphaerochaeta sp.]|jgi:hypothetical protein|nr:hypothetical protein [Sphaerochaeta sp.]